jgi:hypothetical protein
MLEYVIEPPLMLDDKYQMPIPTAVIHIADFIAIKISFAFSMAVDE